MKCRFSNLALALFSYSEQAIVGLGFVSLAGRVCLRGIIFPP